MSPIRLFVIEPNGRRRVSLRRYRDEPAGCPGGHGYHDARVALLEQGTGEHLPERPASRDSRWPARCACGRPFDDDDPRQVFGEDLYAGLHPERGEVVCTLDEAPLGALWRATWCETNPRWRGPDGTSWVVQTPGGPWAIDRPLPDGSRWTRSGSPPRFTVHPSILIEPTRRCPAGFHAFLTEGVLVPC